MVTLPKSKISLTALGFCLSLIALALAGVSKFLGASVPAFSWLEFAAVSTSYVCTLLATQQFRQQYYGVTIGVLAWMGTERAPFVDSFILDLSILAQWLLDNKKLETWFVWMAVNVIAIYTYFKAGLWLAGYQYIFFLGNTFIGLKAWRNK